jgi:hypothetical protein
LPRTVRRIHDFERSSMEARPPSRRRTSCMRAVSLT